MSEEIAPQVHPVARKQDRSTIVLLAVAAMIAIGGIGFAAGRFSAPAAASTGNGNFGGNGGFGRFGGNFPSLAPGQTFGAGQFGNGGGLRGGLASVSGTVQSIGPDSMTVKLANGSTVTIALTGNTTYHSETAASAGDVQSGSAVTVQIDTSALAGQTPQPGASGVLGGRSLTASSVLITTP